MDTEQPQICPEDSLVEIPQSAKKKLEHCNIRWEFRKLQPGVQAGFRHVSPKFKIHRESECQWVLKLDCKLYDENHKKIYIYLKRCPTATGPKLVHVSFIFGFQEISPEAIKPIIWAPADKQHAFEMKDKQSMDIPGIEDCFKSMLSTTDIFIICLMTAHYGEYLVNKIEPELLKLSEDFLTIYGKAKMPDLTLLCEGGCIKVHKSILTARSKHFESLLESTKKDVLKFPGLDFIMMNDIMSFVYSGNWNVVLKDFVPSSLRNWAYWLQFQDLHEKFQSEEITFVDRNSCERIEYVWYIKSFSLLKNGERISSPLFRSCSKELAGICINLTAWIEKNGELNISFSCFRFEAVCEVCILNAEGRKCFEGNLPILPSPGTSATFKFNIQKLLSNNRELYLPQDTLSIHCCVNIFKDKDESFIRAEKCTRIEDPSSVTGVQKFSKDMENLLRTKQYSDFTLASKRRKHKVHKVILANRPSELQPKIASLDPSATILHTKLSDKELENLIHIAYTGKELTEKSQEKSSTFEPNDSFIDE